MVQAAILVAAPVILAVVRAVQVAAPVVVRVLLALAVLQAATAAVLRAVVLPTEVVLIAHLAKANLPPKASRVDLTLAGAASIAGALIRARSITVKVLLGARAEVSRKAIEASHLANLLKEKMQEARIKNLLEVEIKADKIPVLVHLPISLTIKISKTTSKKYLMLTALKINKIESSHNFLVNLGN